MNKNNEKIRQWFKIMWPILLALVVVVYGYGRLNGKVENLETQSKESQELKEKVIRMEEGIEYLKKAVDRIENKIDEP